MKERVDGVYPTVDEALEAVDRLREQGYTRDEIRIVANKEVKDSFTGNVDTGLTTEDYSMDRVDDTTTSQVTDTHTNENRSMDRVDDETVSNKTDEDKSFWDSVKDAFTIDDSDADSNGESIAEYREVIRQGQILVLVKEDQNKDITNGTNTANAQPNTVGPEGTRAPEDEMIAESREEELKKDHELTKDELDDYERRQ